MTTGDVVRGDTIVKGEIKSDVHMGNARVLDYQPGNATRYIVVITHVGEHGYNTPYVVSLTNFGSNNGCMEWTGTPCMVPDYLHEKMPRIMTGDAQALCELLNELGKGDPLGPKPNAPVQATCTFLPGDVQTLFDVDDDRATTWLADNRKHVQDAMCRNGWEAIEALGNANGLPTRGEDTDEEVPHE